MKAKKVLKRLTRVEAILSNVLDQYSGSEEDLREPLNSAKTSVSRAMEAIHLPAAPTAVKKPPVRAPAPSQRRLTAAGRKKISLAAKRRWATAKRKGINVVTGRPLGRTA